MPNILLVEDNTINRDILSRRLRRRSFDIELAVDGVEGFERTCRKGPDLILMDLGLPDVDGWEPRLIRENDPVRDIPVVALTAHAMVSDRKRALASGFDDFAAKPIDFNNSVGIIARLLGVSSEVLS